MKGLKRLFGIATLVLLMVLTIAPINTFANQSIDDLGQKESKRAGEEPEKGKVIVNYEAQFPGEKLKTIELTGEVGTAYSINILDFPGYTFTEVAPPDGGHAQLEGFFEEQDQHAYLFYETNVFTQITLKMTVRDNKNIKGHRPDTITYSIYRKDPSTGVETIFLTENRDVTDLSEDYLYIFEEKYGEYPRFNSEGKKYEYRLETQEMPYYKNTEKLIRFDNWYNNMDVTIEEESIADTVDVNIYKRFGSDIDTRRRMMFGLGQEVTPQRPESVTIHIKRDGSDIAESPVILNDANNWEVTLKNLPNIDDTGKEIQYEIVEEHLDGFQSEVNIKSDYTDGYSNKRYLQIGVVNKYVVDVTATKMWVNAPTVKPDVTLQLHELRYEYDHEQDLEVEREVPIGEPVVLSNGQTSFTWTNLEKYTEMYGQYFEKVYRVRELDVSDDYIVSYSADTFTITNTYTQPVVPTVDVTGTKTWVDDNDAAGLRPTSITVNLLKNGTKIDSVEVNADDGWKYSFTGLPKQENGQDIVYTVSEETVDKYDTSYQGYDITNTYTPAAVPTVDVTGTKTWVDDNDAASLRPTSITVNLLKNDTKIDSVEVKADNGWKYSFTGLPKQENGQDIVYTVSEETVAKYVTSYQGYDITNTYTPAAVPTVDVTGTKTWVDDNDAAGLRPTSITVNLLKNGTKIDSVEVKADDGWKYSFTGLPKQENGQDIVYTVSEETVAKYVTSYQGYDITNTYTPAAVPTVEVTGTKTWVDDNDAAGLRPTSITVNLLKNGTKIDSVEVNADNGWKYSFTGLPKQENGQDIVYTVSEDTVDKYDTSYQGYDITNTYTPTVVPTDPEVPLEPTDPEVPVTPVEPIEPGKPSEPESPQLPSTGVSNVVLVISTVSMLSGLILLVSSNTRRKVTE